MIDCYDRYALIYIQLIYLQSMAVVNMIAMLVLKYDQYRISTGVLVCLYSGHLTSSTRKEVLLCFHVTHSRMHSHMYDQFFI